MQSSHPKPDMLVRTTNLDRLKNLASSPMFRAIFAWSWNPYSAHKVSIKWHTMLTWAKFWLGKLTPPNLLSQPKKIGFKSSACNGLKNLHWTFSCVRKMKNLAVTHYWYCQWCPKSFARKVHENLAWSANSLSRTPRPPPKEAFSHAILTTLVYIIFGSSVFRKFLKR